MSLADDISTLLNDGSHAAAIELFMELLRDTPGLRQWLRLTMLDPDFRLRLDAWLDGKTPPPDKNNQRQGHDLLSLIAGAQNVQTEARRLRKKLSLAAPTHGGLTRARLHALIRRHQAGPLALAPFLLIAAWRKTATDKTARPAALIATEKFFNTTLAGDAPAHFRQLARAAAFFQGAAPGAIDKTHYGHAKWWQMNILLYMLAHPKPAYRTREFTRHLASQKLPIDPADIRRFCRKHHITRNPRPGRPKRP